MIQNEEIRKTLISMGFRPKFGDDEMFLHDLRYNTCIKRFVCFIRNNLCTIEFQTCSHDPRHCYAAAIELPSQNPESAIKEFIVNFMSLLQKEENKEIFGDYVVKLIRNLVKNWSNSSFHNWI